MNCKRCAASVAWSCTFNAADIERTKTVQPAANAGTIGNCLFFLSFGARTGSERRWFDLNALVSSAAIFADMPPFDVFLRARNRMESANYVSVITARIIK